MRPKGSLTGRRTGIVINYAAILMILVVFYIGVTVGWNAWLIATEGAALLIAAITFARFHLKTHLWKLVHAKSDNLDERELQVTNTALGHSYAIFTVLCLSVLLVLTLTETKGSGALGVLLPASLIYLAHTLPSSVIAWTQRRV